jgi:hypothetical protein
VEASKLKTPRKIDAADALARVQLISPRLREDVGTAALSYDVMEAANNTIPTGLAGIYTPFSSTYSAGQNALSLKVAMDPARIFDLSEGHPAEAQDKASIPWAFRLTPPLVDSDDLLSQPTSPGRTALSGLWEY